MTPTTTTTSGGAADLPAMVSKALREAYNLGQRYWQQADSEYISQHKKADDTRAKFLTLVEETCAALAAGQATAAPAQPAAQQGVAYAALPESFLEIPDVQDESGINAYYSREVVLECIDAALASHGQAPADAKALAEADRRAGEAERLLATCKEAVMRFEQARSRMKYQWGAEQRVSFDEVWDEALALKKAAQAAPQAADSVTAPAPPPECETEAEKRAFAFGWFKAVESERMKAESVQEDAARLDYLHSTGSTIEMLPGEVDFYPMRFRIGGLHSAVSPNLREAIDIARARLEGKP